MPGSSPLDETERKDVRAVSGGVERAGSVASRVVWMARPREVLLESDGMIRKGNVRDYA